MSLAARLGWGVALITLIAGLVPALALTAWSRAAVAQRDGLAMTALRRDLTDQVGSWTGELRERSSELSTELQSGSILAQRGEALQAWSELARARAAVEFLWVVDGQGQILACGHWPARAGSQHENLLVASEGVVAAVDVVDRNRDIRAVLLMTELSPAPAGERLVIGMDPTNAAARSSSPATGTRLTIISRAEQAGLGTEIHGEELQARVAVDDSGTILLAGRRLLTPMPGPPQLPLLGGLVLLALLTAGGAAVMARRALRPLREMDRMAAALSHGRLDLELASRDGDELDGLATTFNEMTASLRRQAQELATTARLAAWRDAARRLAHEVKNPLAPIRMSVENLTHAREKVPERFDELFLVESRTILAEVDALTRLVDSFSRFAREPDPRLRPVQASLPLEHVVSLHQDAGGQVQVKLEAAEHVGVVDIDVDLMGQVFKNLVLNALAAVPRPGGEVVLSCAGERDSITYQVRDNGVGIPEEIREHLFEPRVTARSGGTGLGLAVARQIVVAHGGTIEFETAAGGTCFTIHLPRAAAAGKDL